MENRNAAEPGQAAEDREASGGPAPEGTSTTAGETVMPQETRAGQETAAPRDAGATGAAPLPGNDEGAALQDGDEAPIPGDHDAAPRTDGPPASTGAHAVAPGELTAENHEGADRTDSGADPEPAPAADEATTGDVSGRTGSHAVEPDELGTQLAPAAPGTEPAPRDEAPAEDSGAHAAPVEPDTTPTGEPGAHAAPVEPDRAPAAGEGTDTSTTAMPTSDDPDEEARNTQRLAALAAAKRPTTVPTGPREELDRDAQRRRKAREAALNARPMLARILQTVLAVAFPFILLIAAIRAVASPWFLWLDYHRPGFPADAFGFSQADRLTYGNYGVDYINNSAPSSYLGQLVDGNGNPLFLATEVSHMADVKSVIGITYAAGAILLVLAIIICLYLGRKYAGGIRRAFFAGSVATLVIMIALAVLAILNFETFFTDFHELFFSQGNWTFHVNDTLIRLYPTQFWMDAGIVIAGLVLIASILFLITNWPTARRRERSRLLQNNRDFGLN